MQQVKKIGKAMVMVVLSWQLRRLRVRHDIVTVGVAGSYGKTSTKFGIATVLNQEFKVRFQAGNYNDLVTVPLVFFGEPTPSLLNPLAWLKLFIRNERQIYGAYPYDVVVLELGTDRPGQIGAFGRYLQLDFLVITSIAHEHMEFFADLQAVADEELSAQAYSKQILYNADLCADTYMAALKKPATTYGYDRGDYTLDDISYEDDSFTFRMLHGGKPLLEAAYRGAAKVQLYSTCAAAIIGRKLDMPVEKIIRGINAMTPVSGRMQLLAGIRDSTILDETYNSSPEAAIAALDVLYGMAAPQKVALLGNMNELGPYSPAAHTEVGDYCDPEQIDLVITLGPDANAYLAPAARARGCQVRTCDTPYEAADILRREMEDGALLLAKGSQNKVFAEEAVKLILADQADAGRLVRQSQPWLKKKAAIFGSPSENTLS